MFLSLLDEATHYHEICSKYFSKITSIQSASKSITLFSGRILHTQTIQIALNIYNLIYSKQLYLLSCAFYNMMWPYVIQKVNINSDVLYDINALDKLRQQFTDFEVVFCAVDKNVKTEQEITTFIQRKRQIFPRMLIQAISSSLQTRVHFNAARISTYINRLSLTAIHQANELHAEAYRADQFLSLKINDSAAVKILFSFFSSRFYDLSRYCLCFKMSYQFPKTFTNCYVA